MHRVSIKITGAQGQGINSVGELCAKGLKRGGYCVFGYREYMSLIKGGHSSYQLDVSDEKVESTEMKVDILVCFNHHGLEINWNEVKPGGVILHQTPDWEFSSEQKKKFEADDITVIYMPTDAFLAELKAPPILGNILITTAVWTLLGRDASTLKEMVNEQFGHKGEKILQKNYDAIDRAEKWVLDESLKDAWSGVLPEANAMWNDALLLLGSQAMGLGLIHAGCRLFVGYPMTPSTPILEYMAETQNDTGIIIKQAEDEITAAQMMSGAMHMGTRAATATSGGGFDLMSETVSLNALIENPSLFILAQRPGPATGLPTWTAQGDLTLAIGAAHGEFPRIVMSVSDAQDNFALMPEAFNLAERYQTPVIVLTDKQITEGIFTTPAFDTSETVLDRGNLVVDSKQLSKLQSTDRYDPTAKDGVSPRWLPGSDAATYCAQGDEHDSAGNVDESSENAVEQMDKRMRKMEALRKELSEPEVYSFEQRDMRHEKSGVLIVSWGSNKGVILDVLSSLKSQVSISYLHYTYLWPLKTDLLQDLASKAKNVILVECNKQGQLGMLIKQECGLDIPNKILKYDGRPFFIDELSQQISALAGQSAG